MGTCELCGKSENNLFSVKVAGTFMKVCSSCKSMGRVLEEKKNYEHSFRRKRKDEQISYDVVSDFVSRVRKSLSKRNMDIQHLARAVNVKESTLQKYMTSKLSPDIETARKIGKFLEIELVEEVESSGSGDYIASLDDDNQSMSLGDMIKKQMGK